MRMDKLKTKLYREFDEKTVSMILIFNIFILLIALIAVYLKGNNLINKLQEYYLAYIYYRSDCNSIFWIYCT